MTHEPLQEFYLLRHKDLSGNSGEGIVARGMVLPSGRVVLEWLTFETSINIYQNIESVKHLHGHNGATEIILGSPNEKLKKGKKNG